MKLLLDCDIIWSLETKMDDLILHRLLRFENKVDDKNMRLIEMLLKSGKINVNARGEKGKTALHWADDEKLILLLLHYGADVNKNDNEGKTPLMHMSKWGIRVSVLQTVLNEARSLVDLDAIDYNGRTALMIAASDNQPDVVELLLNAGASLNLSDHLGFTAIHHALLTRFDPMEVFYNSGLSVVHGSKNPTTDVNDAEFRLGEDEYITEVNVQLGCMIDGLKFTTNKCIVYGPYGGLGGKHRRLVRPCEGAYLAYITGGVDVAKGATVVRRLRFFWEVPKSE